MWILRCNRNECQLPPNSTCLTPVCEYDALRANGILAKVAIVVVMRKFIEMANTLVKADHCWAQKCP